MAEFEIRHYVAANGRDLFGDGLDALADRRARAVILLRVARVQRGLLGDCRPSARGYGSCESTSGRAIASILHVRTRRSFCCCAVGTRGDKVKTSRRPKPLGQRTRAAAPRSAAHTDYLQRYLADDRNVVALLDAAFEGGDEGDIMFAMRSVALARGGVAELAASTGLSRETLYRTLSRSGNPRLSTLLAVMAATGVRLRATIAEHADFLRDRGDRLPQKRRLFGD